jgi:hypothetical protein
VIGQVYPRGANILTDALDALDRLRRLWECHVEADPSDVVITTDDNGAGRITVYPNWPQGARESLTSEFRQFVNRLWDCLDSLIIETVEMFSALERTTSPERDRFFPIADSEDGFDALLHDSCIAGVLAAHAQIVSDCQPFRTSPDDPVPVAIRQALQNLLDWADQLNRGAHVDAWVTPVSPEVWVMSPCVVTDIEKAIPGPIEDGRVVAEFRVSHPSECSVEGQAGSYVDFCLPDGFVPESADDTFDRRLAAAVAAVGRLAALFARETVKVPGLRAVAQDVSGVPQAEVWTSAHRSSHAWTERELGELAEQSDIGIGVVRGAEELTLLVTTEDGVYERVIPTASPLNAYVERGRAAEVAVHSAAATWGLPDLVFLPSTEHRGSRNREISDGLIVTGNKGVVLQVKSRDAVTPSEKEPSWIDKKVRHAAGQVDGTVRRLCGSPVEMINGRGRSLPVNGRDISWVGVVLLDHSNPPEGHAVERTSGRVPIITLLRRDWEFLFSQLRSASAVVDYLHRVDGSSRIGAEPERYFELAAADAAAEPAPIGVRGPGEHISVPRLPMAPAGRDDDQAHGMVRIMCEDIATSPHAGDEWDRLRLLAVIDSLAVAFRTELGRLLIDGLADARDAPEQKTMWRLRTFKSELGQPQLGFGVCSRLDDLTSNAFRAWALLRHHERAERPEQLADSLSLGVLLTPRRDGLRDWDTTLFAVEGDPGLSIEQLESWRRVWNSTGY